MVPRSFAFGCGPDEPVGASLRDPQWSYLRGIDGVAVAINSSPVLRTPVVVSHRAQHHQLEVRMTAKWDGKDPGETMASVDSAVMEFGTFASRYSIILTCEVYRSPGESAPENSRRSSSALASECITAHLEVPAVVDGGRLPPESGYFIVHGKEYILRGQEHSAFGVWIVAKRDGVASCSMRSPPRWPGTSCFTTRMVAMYSFHDSYDGPALSVGPSKRERRMVALGPVLALMGEADARSYADRVCEPSFVQHVPWPATLEEAEAALRRHLRPRFAPAEGLGIRELTLEELLSQWILPHVPPDQKLGALAHASARLARGTADDLDHIANKRFDAAGDLLAMNAGYNWDKARFSCVRVGDVTRFYIF